MKKLKYEEFEAGQTVALIENKESFEVLGLTGKMISTVKSIENQIETAGLKCRIYTYGRIAAAGGSVFGGITGVAGLASAAGIAAHNLLTYNPDYEISKHHVDNKIIVTYKKSPKPSK
jgi:hypothetical protein